jgi:membrane protein required for colicin V production
LEKYVNDSVLYPYLREAGSYLINLDTSAMGLTVSDTTEIVVPSDINASVETNISVETNASITEPDNSTGN